MLRLPATWALLGTMLAPATALADAADVRVALEPGAATAKLHPAGDRIYGGLGAASIGVGISRLAWMEIFADHEVFATQDPDPRALTLWGFALAYNLDAVRFRPSFEIGIAYGTIHYRKSAPEPTGIQPLLGGSVDYFVFPWLYTGAGVRYFPLFESDLLNQPAYATFHARVGLIWRIGS